MSLKLDRKRKSTVNHFHKNEMLSLHSSFHLCESQTLDTHIYLFDILFLSLQSIVASIFAFTCVYTKNKIILCSLSFSIIRFLFIGIARLHETFIETIYTFARSSKQPDSTPTIRECIELRQYYSVIMQGTWIIHCRLFVVFASMFTFSM